MNRQMVVVCGVAAAAVVLGGCSSSSDVIGLEEVKGQIRTLDTRIQVLREDLDQARRALLVELAGEIAPSIRVDVGREIGRRIDSRTLGRQVGEFIDGELARLGGPRSGGDR